MIRKPLIRFSVLAFSFATLAFTTASNFAIEIGDMAPMVKERMAGVDGTKQALLDLKKENGLVVVFSCNTCPFVVGSDSFGGWERMYNELADMAAQKNLGFVLINSNEAKRDKDDSMEAMKQRAELKNYNMPYLEDKNSKLADAFGAKTTPHVYLLDKNMAVAYMGSIDNSWDNARKVDIPYLQNAMKALIAGEKITEATTAPRGCSIKRK